MKKTVIVCGLIAGLIVSGMLVFSTLLCTQKDDYQGNMVLGFISMFLAFSFIFVGIKNHRDKHSGGIISFGKAFLTGLYIALIASTMYVVVWLIDYYIFIPDFMEKYTAHEMKAATDSGLGAAELAEKAEEMASFKEMYKNPIWVVLLTYMEILPLGIVVTLICALILKRKTAPVV